MGSDMKKFAFAASILAVLAVTALPASAQSFPSQTLAWQTSNTAMTVGQTSYAYVDSTTGAVVSTLSSGKLDITTDCSGWVSYNLRNFPEAYAAVQGYQTNVPGEANKPFPRADVYQRYFASLTAPNAYFTPVTKLTDIQPGDILAWCLDGYCAANYSATATGDTGHAMVVMGAPVSDGNGGAFVLVLDSSTVTHYSPSDLPTAVAANAQAQISLYSQFPNARTTTTTTATGTKTATSGVGPGFILFGADSTGAINSFQFNVKDPVISTAGNGAYFAVARVNANVPYAQQPATSP
ncbi:hypothetical protein DS843_00680 [Roseomonas genomospecies 6]|uniref:Uncharacterized protein n=2 Tax=Roseomonas genomospecies 6 TaxID=214106 RepID=A0A9W7NNT8_9PROT|nr:hypothetical protein DS843_00680 [Roseomonas genomospecies 6]